MHHYEQSDEKGASQELRNACKKCGKTREAHKPPPIRIVFQGIEHFYKSDAEAKADGFYPVSMERGDFVYEKE